MSDTADVIKNNADYQASIERTVANIGKVNGTKLPASNDRADQIVQEYAIAKMLAKVAAKRLELAEKSMKALYPKPTKAGGTIVHNTAFAQVKYDLKAGQWQRTADSIAAACKRHGVSMEKYNNIQEDSKTEQVQAHIIDVSLLR